MSSLSGGAVRRHGSYHKAQPATLGREATGGILWQQQQPLGLAARRQSQLTASTSYAPVSQRFSSRGVASAVHASRLHVASPLSRRWWPARPRGPLTCKGPSAAADVAVEAGSNDDNRQLGVPDIQPAVHRPSSEASNGHGHLAPQHNSKAAETVPVPASAAADTELRDEAGAAQPMHHQIQPPRDKRSLDKEIFALMLPAMLTFSLDPLLGAVDTAIVGRLGATALGAVGISNTIMNFTCMCFKFLSVVTTPAVAAAVVNNDKRAASRATTNGLWVAWACGLPVGLALYTFAPQLLGAMKASGPLLTPATEYLRARAFAAPVVLSLFVVQATFRGMKDTRTPLKSSILSNGINLSLDLILVFVVGMGVAGAAWATSASQYASLAFLGATLLARKMLDWRDVVKPPAWGQVAPLVKAGVMLTAQSMISTILLLQSAVYAAQLGGIALAAHEVARQVFALQFIVFAAVELTSQSMIASELGRGDKAAAGDTLSRVIQLALGGGLAMSGLIMLSSLFLPQVFTNNAEVIDLARRVIPIVALGSPLDAVAAAVDGGLQGAAEYRWVSAQFTAASVVSFLAIQASMRLDMGLVGVWAGLRVIAVVRLALGWYRLQSGRSRLSLGGGGTPALAAVPAAAA